MTPRLLFIKLFIVILLFIKLQDYIKAKNIYTEIFINKILLEI